ncbi:MAG: metallophosphoesterase family protein [Armatimonadota bacterium]
MNRLNRSTGLLILVAIIILAGIMAVFAQTPEPDKTLTIDPGKAQSALTPAPDINNFIFAVIGDNRPARANSPQTSYFKKMVKEMDEANPAFALNVGDAVYGSSNFKKLMAQYKDYTDILQSTLRAKMFLAIGNHEVQGFKANQAFFTKELGGLYYSFDYGNSHFTVLNSEIIGQTAKITGDQLAWLKTDLQKSKARHKFVFIHRPLYPVDGHAGKCIDQYPKERDSLHNLFVRNRVEIVFAGHEHLFNEQVKNHVRYIITGGGGAPTYPSVSRTGDFYHYLMVTVNGDKVEMKLMKPAQYGKKAEVIKIGVIKE